MMKLVIRRIVRIKHGMEDSEVFIRVSSPGLYRMLIYDFDTGKLVTERYVSAKHYCKNVRGKEYCYVYIRARLPYASVISAATRWRENHALIIEILPVDGEEATAGSPNKHTARGTSLQNMIE